MTLTTWRQPVEAEDEQLIEETLDNIAGRCNHSAVCEGTFLACSRYVSHPGQCKTKNKDGTWYSWWGRNKAPYEGMQDSVWKTINYTKHVLMKQQKGGPFMRETPLAALDEEEWGQFTMSES